MMMTMVAMLELIENKNETSSPALIEAAFKIIYDKTKELKFDKIVDSSVLKKYFLNSAISIVIVILTITLIPGLYKASDRLVNYSKGFIQPPRFIFNIQPGNQTLTKGENVTLKIAAVGEQPTEVELNTKSS